MKGKLGDYLFISSSSSSSITTSTTTIDTLLELDGEEEEEELKQKLEDLQYAMEVLLQPIRNRFVYHFILNDATNSITASSVYVFSILYSLFFHNLDISIT